MAHSERIPERDRTASGEGPLDFPAGSFRTPGTFLFWGAHRLPLNRALLALGRRVDPGFLWLEYTRREDPPDPGEPSATGEIGPSRLYRVEEEVEPVTPPRPSHVDRLLQDDATSPVRATLQAFLRLPEAIQELVGRIRPGRGPRILAVANLDRVLRSRSDEPESLRFPLAALKSSGVTLLASACQEPRRDRFDFDNVYRLTWPPESSWRESLIEAEQGALSDRRLGRVPVRSVAPLSGEFAST